MSDLWLTNFSWNGFRVFIAGSGIRIFASSINKRDDLDRILGAQKFGPKPLSQVEKRQLETWFENGHETKGPFSIIPKGTSFQKKVWQALQKIPTGKTSSYKDLAKSAGKPNAIRAAANACGANPLPLFIPCHRAIRSDGSIGGFSGGLHIKRKLLKLESKGKPSLNF